MRRAFKNVGVIAEAGNILISFGFDFCAEHEWGISGIRDAFGVSGDESDLTVGRFAVTRAESYNLRLVEGKSSDKEPRLYLLGGARFDLSRRGLYEPKGTVSSEWDEGAFLFSVPRGGQEEAVVRLIYQAMLDKDALIYLAGNRSLFGGSGLVIVRRSTIPADIVVEMEEGLADQKRLKEASEATGIRERVEAWGEANRGPRGFGRAFFALSPSWLEEGFTTKDGPRVSAHPVIYWLNPYDQQNNNFGWYTVEELEQWMEGKGPIPMTHEQRRKRA